MSRCSSLNEALCRHRIFRLIQTDSYILAEAKQLTEMPIAEGDPLEMDAHDHEILRQICAYEDYLENPKKYGRIKNPEELSEDAAGMVSELVSAHSAKAGGENAGAADRTCAVRLEVAAL